MRASYTADAGKGLRLSEMCKKIEKVLENREKEVLNQFVNISAVVQSMIEAINEKIPDPRKWNRRLKATLFIKKFNEAVS